jgi:hypothetical protein
MYYMIRKHVHEGPSCTMFIIQANQSFKSTSIRCRRITYQLTDDSEEDMDSEKEAAAAETPDNRIRAPGALVSLASEGISEAKFLQSMRHRQSVWPHALYMNRVWEFSRTLI